MFYYHSKSSKSKTESSKKENNINSKEIRKKQIFTKDNFIRRPSNSLKFDFSIETPNLENFSASRPNLQIFYSCAHKAVFTSINKLEPKESCEYPIKSPKIVSSCFIDYNASYLAFITSNLIKSKTFLTSIRYL